MGVKRPYAISRATIIALAACVASCGGEPSRPAAAPVPPAMFRGGHSQPGVYDTGGLDRLGGLAWRFRTDGPVRSSPTVSAGAVYFGSTDGRLYAVDAETGSERWRYEAGAPVGGAPLVTGTLVVFVDRANRITALRPDDGRLAWQVGGGADVPLAWGMEGWDYLLASPMLAGDLVVAGTGDGFLYAIDAGSGEVRWSFRTGGRIRSAPAVHEGVAYIGSCDGIVYGVSLEDGTEVWRFTTRGHELDAAQFGFDRTHIYSSPTIADGTLYIGSRDASLYAIDLETREARWTFEQGTAWVMASPAVADGRVFSSRSSGGTINAVDVATGALLWTITTGGLVYSSPIVVGQTVYIGSEDGGIYALDVATGEARWVYRTESSVFSTPTLLDGRLYIGSDDGYLYALEAADGPQPRLAVFWDEARTPRAIWGSDPSHKAVADYFTGLGYEPIDSAGLEAFLGDRIADRVPSVVMMAMDAVPETVLAPGNGGALLREYLDAGGKVVWMGFPPLLVVRDSAGAIIGVDRERPGNLLGVDHGRWDTDRYGAQVTGAGREWGLESDWVGTQGTADETVTALAIDELGRASAWARSYGGAPGTGFVFVRMGTDADYLRELRRVVEYGILRPAGPQANGTRM